MGSSERHLLVAFLVAGVVSGLLCWAGGLLLPEGSVLLDVYPGVVVGLALFVVGRLNGLGARVPRALSLLILVAAAVASWRAAVDIGYVHGSPLPMLKAGALGAFILALGVVLGWAVRTRVLAYVVAVTLAGAVAGQIFQLLWDAFPGMDDEVWTLTLFVEWQTLVMLSIGLATIRSGARGT